MNTFDPNYKETPINFHVGQKVVVFNSENRILFLKRSALSSRPGGWDFPGGGLENEDPLDGVKREAREEASIEITDVHPLAVASHETTEPRTRKLVIGYVGRWKSGEVKLSWEHDEFRWLSIDEALKIELPIGHTTFLKAAVEYKRD